MSLFVLGEIAVGTMFISLAVRAALFAQDAANGGGGGGGEAAPTGGLFNMLLPFIAIFALFYFLLIRPQRREQAKRQEMLSAVKKNDRIITAGGIYGVVASVNRDANEVTIKVDESSNTKLRMTLSSIGQVVDEASQQSDK